MVFFVMGRSPENIKEKKRTDRRKTLKSEEKAKRRVRGKSNNNNIHLYWFKLYFAQKHIWKKKLFTRLYHETLFTVFMHSLQDV